MKLESKLGLSTGFLVAAMFLSAYTAHTRMAEATRLSDVITSNRLPLIMGSRDLRSHFTDTIRALESYMLFGIDPSSSVAYRNARREQFEQAEASLVKLRQDSAHFDLGPYAQRLAALEEGLAALKPLEENGFIIADFTRESITIRYFRFNYHQQAADVIDTLEPFRVTELKRAS